MVKSKVYIGKRFGKITVLSETDPYVSPTGKKTRRFIVKCDCGKEFTTLRNTLTKIQSCGCVRYVKIRVNLTGKTYGRLTVVSDDGKTCICNCQCGKTVEIPHKILVKGELMSCGCLARETALQKIKDGVTGSYDGTNIYAIRPERQANKNNKLGIKGIYWSKKESRYIAKIYIKGKTITLGRFTDIESAQKARKMAEEKYFTPILERYQNDKTD